MLLARKSSGNAQYYALGNKFIRYWKYVYTPWTQPKATANTTSITGGNMVITASSNYSGEDPWYGFNGTYSGTSWCTNSTSVPGWWKIEFPYYINITGLKFYQRNSASSYRTVKARFYTDSNRTTAIGNEFSPPSTDYGSVTITGIPSGGIYTNTIYLYITEGYSNYGMGMLDITATTRSTIESDSSDYDYTTIPERYFSLARKITKYWKYVDTSWTQPNLTSNISSDFFIFYDPKLSGSTISDPSNPEWGTAAVSNFANIWQAMDGNTSSGYWTVNAGNRIYSVFDITFKNPLKITQIYIDGTVIGSVASALTGSIIYDMSSGSPVLMSYSTNSNTNTHTYSNGKVVSKIRICCRPNNDGGSYPTRVKQITITASEQVPTESTSSNYDYSEIVTQY